MRKSLLLVVIMLTLFACKKEKTNSSYQFGDNQIQLNYDKTHQLVVKQNGQTVDNLTIDFKSSDESVGVVDLGGVFKAKKIGETIVTGQINNKTFSTTITVKPYSNLCREPSTEFGASKKTIMAYEKRIKMDETEDYLLYAGENARILRLLYTFENQKMKATGMQLLGTSDVVKESVKFFAERYTPVGQSEDAVFFSDMKKVVIILSAVESIGYMATYIPYDADDFKTTSVKHLNRKYQAALKQLKTVKKIN